MDDGMLIEHYFNIYSDLELLFFFKSHAPFWHQCFIQFCV